MARIIAALFLAAACSSAAAQSSTATSGTTKPTTTAPGSGNAQPKVVIPPAARSGEKGLRVGEGAADEPIEIKRRK
jgi:hypothetical protein